MGFPANAGREGDNAMVIKDVVIVVGVIIALFIAAMVLSETAE